VAVVRRTQVGETRTDRRYEGVRPAVARRARRVGVWRGADLDASWGASTSAGARPRGVGGLGRRRASGGVWGADAEGRAARGRDARRAAPCPHSVAEHQFEMILLQTFE
jgi:hypothetical protein